MDRTNAEKSDETPSPEVGDILSVTAGGISMTYNMTEKEGKVAAIEKAAVEIALRAWVDKESKINNLFPSKDYYQFYTEGKAESDCASSKEAYWYKDRIASLRTLRQNIKIYAEIMAAHYSKKLADKKRVENTHSNTPLTS